MDKDAQQSSGQGPSGGETLDKSLLVVDDDKLFCERLGRAMSSRGFTARTAMSVAEAIAAIETAPPAFAVIDLRLGDGSGLDVMRALKAKRADARGVILTGYGAIATAVMAVKLGAFDYLAKPANADDVVVRADGRAARRAVRARSADVGRPGALGAHPAHLRSLRAQRLRDGAPAQHAPAHAAANFGQTRAKVTQPGRWAALVGRAGLEPATRPL